MTLTLEVPLCVDLDGTLVKTDVLFESWLLLIKTNPFYLFLAVFWLLRGGRAYLKQEIAARVTLNPALLPYNQSVLSYLQQEKNKGRRLVLATAADSKIAQQVAAHLGIFSEVIASDGKQNLSGINKRDALKQKFGAKQFDYVGDARADLPVWAASRFAIVVNAKQSILRQVNKIGEIAHIFPTPKNQFFTILKLLRVHQYVKNFLIFVPLILGHLYLHMHAVLNCLLAFVIFCCTASSAYLINDMVDLEYDRQHKRKSTRPFASGDFSLKTGLMVALTLLLIAGVLSHYLPAYFGITLIAYFVMTLLYSFYFKQVELADVFLLSILYTVRIIAGNVAAQAEFSPWLMAFAIFLFLSLAFLKRYAELRDMHQENKTVLAGRKYFVTDLHQMLLFGTINGYMSVLILALYLNSYKVLTLYRFPEFLWIICFILLYWISRICLLASRGELHGEPLDFAIKDKFSLFALLLILIVIVGSAYYA